MAMATPHQLLVGADEDHALGAATFKTRSYFMRLPLFIVERLIAWLSESEADRPIANYNRNRFRPVPALPVVWRCGKVLRCGTIRTSL